MVDLAPPFTGSHDRGSVASASVSERFDVDIIADREDAIACVDAIGDDAVTTGYQHPSFVRAWLTSGEADPFFIVLRADGGGKVLLPLEKRPGGLAGYIGGRHANGNFPVGSAADIAAMGETGSAIQSLSRARALKGHGVATIALERQHAVYRGLVNPFVDDGSSVSANVALSATLDRDFDAFLKNVSGSRKRKRFRNQMRKLEAMGVVEEIIPVGSDDIRKTLDRFFSLKSERLRSAGITDVFGEPATQAAFHTMFENGADGQPATHEMHVLAVGGEMAAIMGCTTIGKHLTVEFSSFDPAYAQAGPGDLLFFMAIRNACERGFDVFDFGVGDEPFKRSWCDTETWHRDTMIAISAKGRAIATARRARTSLIRRLKSNEQLWRMAKSARKTLSGQR